MVKNLIIVYENKCPKCRFLSKLVYLFDIKGQFTFIPIRSKKAVRLLKEFYPNPPYNFHMIYDDKDLCYTGMKAIPVIIYYTLLGILWPFGGNGSSWVKARLGYRSSYTTATN